MSFMRGTTSFQSDRAFDTAFSAAQIASSTYVSATIKERNPHIAIHVNRCQVCGAFKHDFVPEGLLSQMK